ncbi:MAG: TetR family transcriptional regulator [Methyloligella sp.]|nr:MAG: TetR family transcriptional regulator [Methyloligella sp.]
MTSLEDDKRSAGRPRSFDRDQLIEKVMHLFWDRGYRDLSFNEIATATGLTRASLYNSFKSKEALFFEALQNYSSSTPDVLFTKVKDGEPVGPVFYQVFAHAAKLRASEEKKRGCFTVNCFAELAGDDTVVGQELANLMEEKRAVIVRLINQAVRQKELPKDTDAETTANLVMAFLSGFSLFSKGGASEKTLFSMCTSFLQQIGFQTP